MLASFNKPLSNQPIFTL